MVTHDMGSIIKYCDKVVLLNKGEFIAEGQPGHMVDLYKKILANQMDSSEGGAGERLFRRHGQRGREEGRRSRHRERGSRRSLRQRRPHEG